MANIKIICSSYFILNFQEFIKSHIVYVVDHFCVGGVVKRFSVDFQNLVGNL